MLTLAQRLHKDRFEILNFFQKHKNIYLYGNGTAAELMYHYFLEEGLAIAGVVSTTGSEREFHGFDVKSISESTFQKDDGIFIAVSEKYFSSIYQSLQNIGIDPSQIYFQKIYFKRTYPLVEYYADNYSGSLEGYFSKYTELDLLGRKYKTDKSSDDHNYLNKYEFFLNKWKNDHIKLLELGVFKGGSISTWSEYFKNGHIIGVDIDENCRQYSGGNKTILIKDLGDEKSLDELAGLLPDIIVDDASHFWSHQIKALYRLLPAVSSGGVYILEDLNTSFAMQRMCSYDDATVSAYDFCEALARSACSGTYADAADYRSDVVPFLQEIMELSSMIEMISFIHDSCLIVKK